MALSLISSRRWKKSYRISRRRISISKGNTALLGHKLGKSTSSSDGLGTTKGHWTTFSGQVAVRNMQIKARLFSADWRANRHARCTCSDWFRWRRRLSCYVTSRTRSVQNWFLPVFRRTSLTNRLAVVKNSSGNLERRKICHTRNWNTLMGQWDKWALTLPSRCIRTMLHLLMV